MFSPRRTRYIFPPRGRLFVVDIVSYRQRLPSGGRYHKHELRAGWKVAKAAIFSCVTFFKTEMRRKFRHGSFHTTLLVEHFQTDPWPLRSFWLHSPIFDVKSYPTKFLSFQISSARSGPFSRSRRWFNPTRREGQLEPRTWRVASPICARQVKSEDILFRLLCKCRIPLFCFSFKNSEKWTVQQLSCSLCTPADS